LHGIAKGRSDHHHRGALVLQVIGQQLLLAAGRVPVPDPESLTGGCAGPGVAKIRKELGRSLE
jgi:hypothetical protein